MNYKIIRIVNSTTVQVTPEWSKGDFRGSLIRIAGVRSLVNALAGDFPANGMQESLEGKSLVITSMYYVESGPTLVAIVDIEGVSLATLFKDRYEPPAPRTRMMEFNDRQSLRSVNGRRETTWINPLRTVPLHQRPCLGSCPHPMPGDAEYAKRPDEYAKAITKVDALHCDAREHLEEDNGQISDFLTKREEKMLVLFGDGGIGKSWFIRHWLRKNPPNNLDIAVIDVINYPRNAFDRFQKRLDEELQAELARHVDTRPGGLRRAFQFHFENLARGIFSDLDYEADSVRRWVQDRLTELSTLDHRPEMNELRLKSYAHHEKDLLVIIDNLDAFNHSEQDWLIENVVKPTISGNRVFLIVALRQSSQYFRDRLSSALQRVPKGVQLSRLNLREMIRRRFVTSETLQSIESLQLPQSELTYGKLFDEYYADSEAEALIEDLCQGDVRHYVRLFRRHILSNSLKDYKNISREYHCISTLMFWNDERWEPETAFILNLFDNHHPEEIGNALIRWRVFEFFESYAERGCGEKDEFFTYYFQRLGYSLSRVHEILSMFRDAGILELHAVGDTCVGKLTGCGKRYSKLIGKLWYCIVIKTGMHIYDELILTGENAQRESARLGVGVPKNTEWVSDKDFLEFIHAEEEAELRRLHQNPNIKQEFEARIKANGPKGIGIRLWEAYSHQQAEWNKRRTSM